MTPEAERQAFLEALTTSCTAPSPLRVVMTARTDMWDRVAAETGKFAMSVAPTVLHVPPLSRTDLAEVISEPARRSHLTLEDGLVQRLVDDTGSGDALPLLAFTLARLATDAEDGRLTHAEYDAIGGVKGAIASRASEVAHGWPHRGAGGRGDPAPGQPHRRDPAQAAGPRRRRTAAAPGDPRRPRRRPAGGHQRGQRPAGLRPGARVAVLGLAAAGRADRAPSRRPRAARPARAPRCRLARGWRHPVRAAVRPRARPGSRLAGPQRASSRPPTSRRTSTRRGPASAAAGWSGAGVAVVVVPAPRGQPWSSSSSVNARADRRRADPRAGRRAGGDRPARAGARPGRGRGGAARGLEIDPGDRRAPAPCPAACSAPPRAT